MTETYIQALQSRTFNVICAILFFMHGSGAVSSHKGLPGTLPYIPQRHGTATWTIPLAPPEHGVRPVPGLLSASPAPDIVVAGQTYNMERRPLDEGNEIHCDETGNAVAMSLADERQTPTGSEHCGSDPRDKENEND